MKIASNTVEAVAAFYKKELSDIYTLSELENITGWVLEHILKTGRHKIVTDPRLRINESDMIPLERMCYDLKRHKPVQYVLGEAEFYHLRFKVNENVLIPRPETEEMVERIINKYRHQNTPLKILDIGTGSGCIPISIKKNIPDARVYALDISDKALEIAKYNAKQNDVAVGFFEADILEDEAAEIILAQTAGEKLDILISNPPYVLSSEKEGLDKRVVEFEPHVALFVSDEDPILFYRRIASLSKKILKKSGTIYFECHAHHAQTVKQMLVSEGFSNICLYPDLSGLARVLEASPSS